MEELDVNTGNIEKIYKYALKINMLKKTKPDFFVIVNDYKISYGDSNSIIDILNILFSKRNINNNNSIKEISVDEKIKAEALIRDFNKLNINDSDAVIDWIVNAAPLSKYGFTKKEKDYMVSILLENGFYPQGNIVDELNDSYVKNFIIKYVKEEKNDANISKYIIGQFVNEMYMGCGVLNGLLDIITEYKGKKKLVLKK